MNKIIISTLQTRDNQQGAIRAMSCYQRLSEGSPFIYHLIQTIISGKDACDVSRLQQHLNEATRDEIRFIMHFIYGNNSFDLSHVLLDDFHMQIFCLALRVPLPEDSDNILNFSELSQGQQDILRNETVKYFSRKSSPRPYYGYKNVPVKVIDYMRQILATGKILTLLDDSGTNKQNFVHFIKEYICCIFKSVKNKDREFQWTNLLLHNETAIKAILHLDEIAVTDDQFVFWHIKQPLIISVMDDMPFPNTMLFGPTPEEGLVKHLTIMRQNYPGLFSRVADNYKLKPLIAETFPFSNDTLIEWSVLADPGASKSERYQVLAKAYRKSMYSVGY